VIGAALDPCGARPGSALCFRVQPPRIREHTRRSSGLNWVLVLFCAMCWLGAGRTLMGIVVVGVGMVATWGAWRRQLWGLVAAVITCVAIIVRDVVSLLGGPPPNAIHWLNPLLHAAICFALLSAWREFRSADRP
jgi:hypothetical protein